MKKVNLGLLIATAALFTTGCPYLTSFLTPTPIASTIVFADGAAVAKQLGSGEYTNAATGIGDGAISYLSGTPAIATVNANTGAVALVAAGTTVITASKAATATHAAVAASYTLTVTAKTPSTLIFADGAAVTKQFGSGEYTNAVSGIGDGVITYSSGTPVTATVNASTGAVALVAAGTTVITASKAATATHAAVSAGYTLTVTPAAITLLAISGVTVPATGNTPAASIVDTAQYTGTISWSPSSSAFAASTAYTATITLTPKAGYTLTGAAANSFTVAGATATNTANSGTISAVFPSTSMLALVTVPAGSFQRDATSANVSAITTAFKMSAYEITRAQFASIFATDPVVAEGQTAYSSGTTDPVMAVNWYHAIAFCNKLSLVEGLIPTYAVTVSGTPVNWSALTYVQIPTVSNADWDAAIATWTNSGYRLPTEMEWMWAAMGATSDRSNGYTGSGTNTTGYTKGYSGSTEAGGAQSNIGNYVWYDVNSASTTHPVGTAGTTGHPNELGLYDMNGNVWEWLWDRYFVLYPDGMQTDYRGPVSGPTRGLRGASWSKPGSDCTVARRYGYDPDGRLNGIGFRVMRL